MLLVAPQPCASLPYLAAAALLCCSWWRLVPDVDCGAIGGRRVADRCDMWAQTAAGSAVHVRCMMSVVCTAQGIDIAPGNDATVLHEGSTASSLSLAPGQHTSAVPQLQPAAPMCTGSSQARGAPLTLWPAPPPSLRRPRPRCCCPWQRSPGRAGRGAWHTPAGAGRGRCQGQRGHAGPLTGGCWRCPVAWAKARWATGHADMCHHGTAGWCRCNSVAQLSGAAQVHGSDHLTTAHTTLLHVQPGLCPVPR